MPGIRLPRLPFLAEAAVAAEGGAERAAGGGADAGAPAEAPGVAAAAGRLPGRACPLALGAMRKGPAGGEGPTFEAAKGPPRREEKGADLLETKVE